MVRVGRPLGVRRALRLSPAVTRNRSAVALAVVLMSAGIGAAILVYGRTARSTAEQSSPPPSLSSTVSRQPPLVSSEQSPSPASPAAPLAEGGSTAGSLADILEAEGGQLTDVLAHLKTTCALARRSRGEQTDIHIASRCVEDAEGAMGLVDLIQGSIAGPAAAGMPGDVRNRWEETLASAKATVRETLTPVYNAVGRDLTSGRASAADFRVLGHLRDRIGRVLSTAERP